jgi:hypothetical protein
VRTTPCAVADDVRWTLDRRWIMIVSASRAHGRRSGPGGKMPKKPGEPRRRVIDENAVRFLIGASAILLPVFEILLALPHWLESISASYAATPWPRNLFVGFNFAIGTFMLTYNGQEKWESRLAKIGAVAAYVVALVPGKYQRGAFLIDWLPSDTHVVATLVLFGVLIGFCWIFRRRARSKLEERPHSLALKLRLHSYAAFIVGMVVSVVLFVAHAWLERLDKIDQWHLLLIGETLGLVSFGLAWLMAAKFIFADKHERTHLFAIRHSGKETEIDFLPSGETDCPAPPPAPPAPPPG